jgi:hypothetical protein
MLGGTGSGKTTYLIGMYAHLSAGLENFFLHAVNHDVDIELSSAWSAMIEDGLLPQANTEEGGIQTYDFIFRYGLDPLLTLNWIDYRGGALRDRSEKQDVSSLLSRLSQSDSVYITLDGALLADVLTTDRGADRRLQDAVGRYARLISEISDKRREEDLIPPSIVVLVTKGDLLRPLLPGNAQERRQQVREWMVDLLKQCFRDDWDTAVCIVSIGSIGRPSSSRVDPNTIDPASIHKPMVFSLYSYYRRAAVAFRHEVNRVQEAGTDRLKQRDEIRGRTVRRLLGATELKKLETELGELNRYYDLLQRLVSECQYRSDILADELIDTPMHINGRWIGAS